MYEKNENQIMGHIRFVSSVAFVPDDDDDDNDLDRTCGIIIDQIILMFIDIDVDYYYHSFFQLRDLI
ncbi:hypothetical protein DERP_010472 [Dermatophagoides pteronyssinus]|uniref:Uncharacterized protein n=1 Tax=Dermatophagoides pteronyssinus TaxID=6956 RepID=A0ABQ8J590_DERPT|nr:hypothetical protein DERP_010472 [Dermatophagoides pteronyssinus]